MLLEKRLLLFSRCFMKTERPRHSSNATRKYSFKSHKRYLAFQRKNGSLILCCASNASSVFSYAELCMVSKARQVCKQLSRSNYRTTGKSLLVYSPNCLDCPRVV